MGAVVKLKQSTETAESKKAQWLDSFCQSGDALKAVDDAGYNYTTPGSKAAIASRNKRECQNEIMERTLAQVVSIAPRAIATLADIMDNSDQDSARNTAAARITSLAGMDKVTVETDKADTRTDSQLLSALAELASNDSTFAEQLANIGNSKASSSS